MRILPIIWVGAFCIAGAVNIFTWKRCYSLNLFRYIDWLMLLFKFRMWSSFNYGNIFWTLWYKLEKDLLFPITNTWKWRCTKNISSLIFLWYFYKCSYKIFQFILEYFKELFAVSCYDKRCHLRCLTEFWIYLWKWNRTNCIV